MDLEKQKKKQKTRKIYKIVKSTKSFTTGIFMRHCIVTIFKKMSEYQSKHFTIKTENVDFSITLIKFIKTLKIVIIYHTNLITYQLKEEFLNEMSTY